MASHEVADFGAIGYEAIEVKDLISDLLHDDRHYDAQRIIDSVIRRAGRNTPYVPVFKYLSAIGIQNETAYQQSGLDLNKWVQRDIKKFRVKMYSKAFFKKRHQGMKELIEGSTPEHAATLIPFLARDKIDPDLLRSFLLAHEDKVDLKVSNYASYFRKLAALYDQLKWGWNS